jgi:hypothetical protein
MEVSGQLHAPTALPQGKSPRHPLDRRLGGPQISPGHFGEEKKKSVLGFLLLTAVIMRDSISWDIAPCGSIKFKRCFGRTYCLHFKVEECVRKEISQRVEDNRQLCMLPASFWFLAWLTLQPEDGGYIFFRKVGWQSPEYTALYPRR